MEKKMNVKQWIQKFNAGDFDFKDYHTQCEAGWYDWFCKESSLANKTKRMGRIIKQLKDGGKVNLESMYVWFKNNCPLVGPLYDDFRIADIETGETLFTIQIACHHSNSRYVVYGGRNKFTDPLFKSNSSKELIKWLNEGWE